MFADLVFLTGCALVIYGFALVTPWLAWVVGGSLLIGIGATLTGRQINK